MGYAQLTSSPKTSRMSISLLLGIESRLMNFFIIPYDNTTVLGEYRHVNILLIMSENINCQRQFII